MVVVGHISLLKRNGESQWINLNVITLNLLSVKRNQNIPSLADDFAYNSTGILSDSGMN